MDSSVCAKISVGMPPNNKFSNYFLALGTFLFSYGGHPGFPTIQHDMKKPKEFTKASIIAFLSNFYFLLDPKTFTFGHLSIFYG